MAQGEISTRTTQETLVTTPTLIEAARTIIRGPSFNRTKTAGYDIKPGEKVLLVEKSTDDPAVTEALISAMHEIGAHIDIFHVDILDRPLTYIDEFRGMMYNVAGIEPDPMFDLWRSRIRWLEDVAQREGYSLLIQGEGGKLPDLDGVRYEGIPWYHRITFPAAGYPWPVWDLINEVAWKPIWEQGRGGRARITDPEGSSLEFGLREEHWTAEHYESRNARRRFESKYYLGHLYGHPTPPYDAGTATGVIAGTLNHYGRPFPRAEAVLEEGRLVELRGGGEYGEFWRELMDTTKNIKYPEYPGEGLFWLWECAIGTHPKMVRPPVAFSLAGHAAMFERLRSGYIHFGIGTAHNNPSELWAREQGHPYGHVHIHQLFPTYTLITRAGEEIPIIERGRLVALDDPAVRRKAEEFGDPDDLLSEAWIPAMPGVTVEGDYERDYAPDPAAWIEANDRNVALAEG